MSYAINRWKHIAVLFVVFTTLHLLFAVQYHQQSHWLNLSDAQQATSTHLHQHFGSIKHQGWSGKQIQNSTCARITFIDQYQKAPLSSQCDLSLSNLATDAAGVGQCDSPLLHSPGYFTSALQFAVAEYASPINQFDSYQHFYDVVSITAHARAPPQSFFPV